MKKRLLLFLFLSVFLIGISGPANATTIGLKYNSTSPPGESGNFSIIGNVLYGTYRLDVDWDLSGIPPYDETIDSFCVQNTDAPDNYTLYDLVMPSSKGSEYVKASYLFSQYLSGASATATQIAIWEVIFETSGTYNVSNGAGTFYAISGVPTEHISEANMLLSGIPTSFDDSNYRIAWNPIQNGKSIDTQNYIIYVPEPGALIGLGIVLLSLGGIATRRFKR